MKQKKLYRQFLESDSVKDALNSTKSPLAALTVLKKICDHPFLLSKNMIAACKQGEQAKAKSNQHMNASANANVNNENFNNMNNMNMVNNFMNNSNNSNSDNVINGNGIIAVNNNNNNDNNNISNSKNKNEKDSMFSFNELQKYQNDTSPENALKFSTKMGVLLKILEAISQGNSHRVLVFSQFKIILSLIESLLKSKNMGYLRMDGDTDMLTRQTYVDQFNNDSSIFVFLLTTGVGSLGLNLIGADRVIIFDPDWNPAKDAQAVDRAYRVGQERNVLVYRLVTCATIEEKIYRRQVSKIGLLKSVTERDFAQRSRQQRYFTKKELKQVFKLDDPNVSETQRLFSRFNNVMIGKNIQFDNEIQRLDLIPQVFGISYHDILFRLEGNGNGNGNGNGAGDGDQEEGEEIDSNINSEIDSIRQSLEAQRMSIQQGSRMVRKRQGTNTRKKVENQGIESFFGNDFANELGDVRNKLSFSDLNDVGAPRNNRNINNDNNNDNGSNSNSNNNDNGDNYLFLNRLKQLEQKQQENGKDKETDKEKEKENASTEKKRRAKKRRQSLVEVFEQIRQKDDENENEDDEDEDEDSGNSNSNGNSSNAQNSFFNANENNKFGSNSLGSVSWFGDSFDNEKEKEDRDSDATVSDYESDEMNKNRNNKNVNVNVNETSFVSILGENKKQREKEEKENNNVKNANRNEHLRNDNINGDINSDEKEIEEIKSHISIKTQKQLASDFKKYRRKSKMFSIADLDDLNDIDDDDDENDNDNGNDNVIDDENEDDETQSENEGESETDTEGETETDDDVDMTGTAMRKENDKMNNNNNRHDKNNGERNDSGKKMKNKACLFHKSNSSKHGYKCTRCECFLSKQQEKEYQTLIRSARICEKEQEWVNAIKHYLIALKIRDSDVNVHVTCETLGKMLAM